MSTPCLIAIQERDGKVQSIYCHGDGYPSWVGRILRDSYADEAKVRGLIGLGSISTLGKDIGVRHPFDRPAHWNADVTAQSDASKDYDAKYGDMTRAYHRDRDEPWDHSAPISYPTEEEFLRDRDHDWSYVYSVRTGKWKYSQGHGGLRALTARAIEKAKATGN